MAVQGGQLANPRMWSTASDRHESRQPLPAPGGGRRQRFLGPPATGELDGLAELAEGPSHPGPGP
eukprot:4996348-Lingulodinium_polyedra.AAC.1